MKKKYMLAAIAMTAAATAAMAAPLSSQQTRTAAETFWGKTLKMETVLHDRSNEWQYPDINIYVSKEGGFVIVSADDIAVPIIGYSKDARITPSNLPIQLSEWLDACQRQIMLAKEEGIAPSENTVAQWDLLTSGKPLPKAGESDGLQPLLKTRWDQDYPYNGMCPANTVTGCAATAQSQMMKYWNFPPFGNGQHAYVHSTFATLSADYAHTIYNWEGMPDTVGEMPIDFNEYRAVAQLMFHVGVSLDMQYATGEQGGSAAAGLAGFPGYASMDNSLKDYFFYSQDMQVITKTASIPDEEWRDTLIAELNRSHPILYTGVSPQGGHGFVCDGYDSLLLMHFNFGWSGEGDGYFAIGSITPGIGPNGQYGTYDFSYSNQALLGGVPDYRIRTNVASMAFIREGGSSQMFFAHNPMNDAQWTVSTDADWISVTTYDTTPDVVIVTVSVTTNNDGVLRKGNIIFRQGDEMIEVPVSQDMYGEEDYCEMTIKMESTRDGWLGGAYLSLESEGGFVYGTATLVGGHNGQTKIKVSPIPLRVVWNGAGGTDRFVTYTILDPSGNERLKVSNAFLHPEPNTIDAPCSNVGIEDVAADSPMIAIANGTASVEANEEVLRIEMIDAMGRCVATSDHSQRLHFGKVASGMYLFKVTTATTTTTERRVVMAR